MKENKKIIIIGLVILLVGCICVMLFNIIFKNNDSNNDNNDEIVDIKKDEKLTEDEALKIAKEKVEFFIEYKDWPTTWCGEWSSSEDGADDYYEAANYNSIEELYDYLKTLVSEEYIDVKDEWVKEIYNVDNLYIEENGKLYCYNVGVGLGDIYIAEKSEFTILNINEEKIEVEAKLVYQVEYDTEEYNNIYNIVLINEDNNWVVSDFKVKNN